MEEVLRTLVDALLAAGALTLAVLLPLFAFGAAMHFLSAFFRRSLTQVFGMRFTAYLTAPGVMLHEISHAAACLLFGHKIRKIVLFSPQKNGTLGFVEHSYNPRSLRQRLGHFFIGTAPLWGGYAAILFLTLLLLPAQFLPVPDTFAEGWRNFTALWAMWFQTFRWEIYLWLYLVLVIGSQITLSKPDLEGAMMGVPILMLLVFLAALGSRFLPQGDGPLLPALLRFGGFQAGILLYILSVLIFFALILKLCLAGSKKR